MKKPSRKLDVPTLVEGAKLVAREGDDLGECIGHAIIEGTLVVRFERGVVSYQEPVSAVANGPVA